MFPIIAVHGSPYDCGKQYGSAVAPLIYRNIDVYLQLIKHHANLSHDAAIQKAKQFIPSIENLDADLIDEIQGIADGSGVSLDDIMLLNARTELLSTVPVRECTAIVVLPMAASPPQVWMGQNWDWLKATEGLTVILKVNQPGKPQITMLVEAGQIGKMGYNETGLGLCHNALETNYASVGVPFIVMCRAILNNSEMNDALHTLCNTKRASSGNFVIAHRDGVAVNVETTPNDYFYLEPVNDIIIHTNHFTAPKFSGNDHVLRNAGWDSVIRYQRARRLLDQDWGIINLDSLVKLQRDLLCGNSSICVRANTLQVPLARWATLAGVVMNLSLKEMFVASGLPVENEYVRVDNI